MRVRTTVTAVVLLLIVFCGCQRISIYKKPKGGDEKPHINTKNPIASYEEPDITVRINRMRAVSTDIYRDVLIGDWVSAKNKCSGIYSFFNIYKEGLLKKGVSDDYINKTDASFKDLMKFIEDKKSFEARALTNEISKGFCDTLYSLIPTVGTEFYNMGYYLRELTLHIEKDDEKAISDDFASELEVWGKVREKLLPIYESDVVQIDEYFNTLSKTLKEKDFKLAKSIILSLISYLELIEMYLTNLQVQL